MALFWIIRYGRISKYIEFLTTVETYLEASHSNWINSTRFPNLSHLTHWGRVTHICVGKLTTIGSDNGLSPGRRQAIIWINAGILLIEPLGANFSEISIEILTFSFKKMRFKVSSAKWRPFCLGLNGLKRLFRIVLQSNKLPHIPRGHIAGLPMLEGHVLWYFGRNITQSMPSVSH